MAFVRYKFFFTMFLISFACLSVVSLQVQASIQSTNQEILERIRPVAVVCAIDEPCAKEINSAPIKKSVTARTGEEIFHHYCTTCHLQGLLGAPKKGDQNEWHKRVKEAGGFVKLFDVAYPGIRSMPARGTCMDCSNKEFQDAMHYMGAPR